MVLLTAHVNPSAGCTLVLDRGLALRAVLAGWPVATLADGRIVYQRNQVHFASGRPVELGLFDPVRLVDSSLYPPRPDGAVRAAHIARMRQVYTGAWCAAHNHPCDPALFDEHLASDVVVSDRGNALAFTVAFDNTTGWSDVERWGRLEPFRELRAALARREALPALARSLVAGLVRARNLDAGSHVAGALTGDPELRDLVGAVLAAPRPAGVEPAGWLLGVDRRWGETATWLRLARLIEVPDETTDVVYVYAGLRRGDRIRFRELPRRDFEARFGPGAPRAALEPAALRQLFGSGPD